MAGGPLGFRVRAGNQRLQYPLTKEYTLNYNRHPNKIEKIYSLIKGYWSLWVRVPGLEPKKQPPHDQGMLATRIPSTP